MTTGYAFGPDDKRHEHRVSAERDRLGCPARSGIVDRDHHDDHRALVASAQGHRIHRPSEALALLGLELGLVDDAEDGLVVDQEHDEIRVVLGGDDLVEGSLRDAGFGEFRHADVQHFAQELGGEFRSVANEREQAFVHERRHRRAPYHSLFGRRRSGTRAQARGRVRISANTQPRKKLRQGFRHRPRKPRPMIALRTP